MNTSIHPCNIPGWEIAGAEREMCPNGFGINPSDVSWRNKAQRLDFLNRWAAFLTEHQAFYQAIGPLVHTRK